MSQFYILTLNTGDSYSTYDIFYDAISNSNFTTLTISGGNATQISYSNMTQGVAITVPDSANQIIIVNLGDCKNNLSLPITPYIPPVVANNLCLSFEDMDNLLTDLSPWTFQPNGTQNGKAKWSYTGSTTNTVYNLLWNLTAQQWQVVVNNSTTFINSNSSQPPTGFWASTNRGVLNINLVEGSCSISSVRITNVTVVNTSCKSTTPCNGTVTITAVGGTPPYQYAISATPGNPSSINWSNSNILQGICEGNINIVVKDSLGSLSQARQATISYDEIPKNYVGTVVQRFQRVTVNTQQPTRRVVGNSEWQFQLDQPLDQGVEIFFRLAVTDSNNLFEPYGQGTYSTVTTVKKNGVVLTPDSVDNFDNFLPSRVCPGAQMRVVGQTKYFNLSYELGDIIEGTTVGDLEITRVDTNSSNCSTIYESFSQAQVLPDTQTPISGCQCCSFDSVKSTNILSLTTQRTVTVITTSE